MSAAIEHSVYVGRSLWFPSKGEPTPPGGSTGHRWKAAVLIFEGRFFPKQNKTTFLRDQYCNLADDGSQLKQNQAKNTVLHVMVISWSSAQGLSSLNKPNWRPLGGGPMHCITRMKVTWKIISAAVKMQKSMSSHLERFFRRSYSA